LSKDVVDQDKTRMSSSRAQLGFPRLARLARLAWPDPILHGGKGLKT